MELCKKCGCNCKPVSIDCIIENSDIQDAQSIEEHLFSKATSNIDDLIGSDCAEELCVALESAAEQAEDNEETDIAQYLPKKWLNVIQNKYFKSWYANKVQWHFLNGASISEIVNSSLITTSHSDPGSYSEDYKRAEETERKRLQRSTGYYVGLFREKFLNTYWNKNSDLYNCCEKECGCKKDFTCKGHSKTNGQQGIGMWIG